MKKLNLKQPKYIFPLVILLPIVFLAYEISQFTKGSDDPKKGVVTDNINMSLPDAANEEMGNKMTEMNKHFSEDGAYTAIGALGDDKEETDSTMSGYSESELNDIDAENAKRTRKQKELEDLERSLAESRKHINSYGYDGGSGYGGGGGYGGRGAGSRNGRNAEMDDYARELERIQNRSMDRQRQYYAEQEQRDKEKEAEERRQQQEMIDALTGNTKKKGKKEEKTEVVEKVKEDNSEKFNTLASTENVDEPLIKAMIDKTTKAREGTRLRFKLLDDVTVKGIRLKKGSYLYGIVTGFGQQRVMANINSILVGNKFIKVNLSVFDNDGMEGFYVPESTFREMMKDAGSSVASQNIQFDVNGTGGLSPEIIALQALQNMYQSASSAVSKNIRKNKAKIKYNTIVYLINTQQE